MSPTYAVLGWLLTIIAIVGNSLVIFLIATRRQLQTATNWFVLSLAAADFAFGASFFPVAYFCETIVACDNTLRGITVWQLAVISIVNLCVMASDRYIAIVLPLKYVTYMTQKRVVVVIAAAWGLPCVVFLGPSLYIHFSGANATIHLFFQVLYVVIFEVLPCVFLLCATGRILVISRRHYRQTAVVSSQLRFNRPTLRQNRGHFSATVILVVVGLFIVFYSMDIAGSICWYFHVCHLSEEFHYARKLLIIANSAANPIPYAFIKRDIKREFKRMFRYKVKRKITTDSVQTVTQF